MPSRLSESPPANPPSSFDPPEAMLLAEMARVVPSPYLLHPPLPVMSDASIQSNIRHTTFSPPLMVLPPLRTNQPASSGHEVRQHDPTLFLRSGHHNSRYTSNSFGNSNVSDSLPSPDFSSVHPVPSDLMTNPERDVRAVDGILQRSAQTGEVSQIQDSSEESTRFMANPPRGPPTFIRQAKSSPGIRHGNMEASYYRRTSIQRSIGESSNSMGKTGLVGTDDPRRSLEYDLIIRQQPVAARACGFGERDRRVIDPPPILQMIVRDPRVSLVDLSPQLRYPNSVVHCELWNANDNIQETAIPELGERRQQRRLMGTLVASPFYGRDDLDVTGCFFPFPDLSCRTIGKYRLRFVLMLPNPATMRPGDSLPFRSIVVSSVFHVYTAKTFPGMESSSILTRRLKEQGCPISVKKGHQRGDIMREASRDEADGDADENEEDEEGKSEKVREKRQRREN